MIPNFPKFKKIDIHDRSTIEAVIDARHPYSTFNFTNIWAWDTKFTRLVSKLNDNLVFLFTDYTSQIPFLTFHGTHKPVHTVMELLDFAKEHKLHETLRFIGEETVNKLQGANLTVIADPNNFDYIFSTEKIAFPHTASMKTKRTLAKRFARENPNAVFEVSIFDTQTEKNRIREVLNQWKENKRIGLKDYDIAHEEIALSRLLQSTTHNKLILSTVVLGKSILGFSIDELLPNKYVMGHFIKADVRYKGIYEFLNEKTAGYLFTNDYLYWNWQQDLGLEGLRMLKQSYKPVDMFKKFEVSSK